MAHPDPCVRLKELITEIQSLRSGNRSRNEARISQPRDSHGSVEIESQVVRSSTQSLQPERSSSSLLLDNTPQNMLVTRPPGWLHTQHPPSSPDASGSRDARTTHHSWQSIEMTGILSLLPIQNLFENSTDLRVIGTNTMLHSFQAGQFSQWPSHDSSPPSSMARPSLAKMEFQANSTSFLGNQESCAMTVRSPPFITVSQDKPPLEHGITAFDRRVLDLGRYETVSNDTVRRLKPSSPVTWSSQQIRQLSSQLGRDRPRDPKAKRTRDAEDFLNDPENLAILQRHQKDRLPIDRAPAIPGNPLRHVTSAKVQKPASTTLGSKKDLPPNFVKIISDLHNLSQQRSYKKPNYHVTENEQGLWSGCVIAGGQCFATERTYASEREAKLAVAQYALRILSQLQTYPAKSKLNQNTSGIMENYEFRTRQLLNWTKKRCFLDPVYSVEPDPSPSGLFFGCVTAGFKGFRTYKPYTSREEAKAFAARLALGWFCQPEGLAYLKQKQQEGKAVPSSVPEIEPLVQVKKGMCTMS